MGINRFNIDYNILVKIIFWMIKIFKMEFNCIWVLFGIENVVLLYCFSKV